MNGWNPTSRCRYSCQIRTGICRNGLNPKSGKKERGRGNLEIGEATHPEDENLGGSQTSDAGIRTRTTKAPQLVFPDLLSRHRIDRQPDAEAAIFLIDARSFRDAELPGVSDPTSAAARCWAAPSSTPSSRTCSTPRPPRSPGSSSTQKNTALGALVNGQIQPLGYTPLGLEDSSLTTTTTVGGPVATFTYGWTEFDIAPGGGRLTVSTFGIPAYNQSEIGLPLLLRQPALVQRFTVDAQRPVLSARLDGSDVVVRCNRAPPAHPGRRPPSEKGIRRAGVGIAARNSAAAQRSENTTHKTHINTIHI